MAVDLAGQRPVGALVVQSTFTHLKDATRATFPTLPVHLLAPRRFHSLEKVRRLTMPKLFIHGDADGTLPLAFGEQLFAAAAAPKELYVVRRAGHNDVHRHGGRDYFRRLRRFCRRHLAT